MCFSIQDVLSPEECKWIIKKTDDYFESEKKDDNYFLSVITQDEELNTFLYERMTPYLPAVFNNKSPVGLYKDLRFLRYSPEKRSNLAPHFDGMAIRDDKARSYITLHFYLNTVEEGGCTRFFDSKLGIQGKKSSEYVDYRPV